MARQRFIHPAIWKDPVFGRLTADEQLFFIGLFSIADDEGRTNADPAYLRSELFAYKERVTVAKVKKLRDAVVSKVVSVELYHANGVDVIALLKWRDYQKPKYPTASKLPPPPDRNSPRVGEGLTQAFPETDLRVGKGLVRDGSGGDGSGSGEGEGRAFGDDPSGGGETEKPSDFKIPKLKSVSDDDVLKAAS